jgi:hypothetical protein
MNSEQHNEETEEDGPRIRAQQIAQYRHQNEQMRQRIAAKTITPEQLQQREELRQEREQKKAEAFANAERDAPIRIRFHAWIERAGYRPLATPEIGHSYPGAHTEAMWEAYLDATLSERKEANKKEDLSINLRSQSAQEMQDEAIANRRKPRNLPLRKPTARRECRITVDYDYDIHSVTVTAKIVDQIKRGEAVTVKGQGFYIEGEKTKDVWSFNCTGPNALEVDGEDGHQIFIGKVSDATITEIE